MNDIILNEIYKSREKMLILSMNEYEEMLNSLFKKLNYLEISKEEKDSLNKIIDELKDIKNAIRDEVFPSSLSKMDKKNISEEIESSFENYIPGKKPIAIKIKGKRFSVETWQDLFEVTVDYFAELDEEKFLDAVGNHPYISSTKNENSRYIKSVGVYLKVQGLGSLKIKRFLNLLTNKFDLDIENDIKLIFKL
ncbi:TPA: hypothetical protein KPJ62_003713 [Clostridioides difficile]|nr:hypothetical protein [Clostridioides difficile]